ncbi:MAG: hypothetical protein JRI97_08180, partial [Deltaproteobacteria bacterium]|nr:hypothetical protein [Deltaproteobacteria bacterium]
MEYRNSIFFSQLVMMDPAKKYIISNENLAGCHIMSQSRHGCIRTWLDERRLILQSLARVFPDARLMVSFRKHASYIISLYKEYLHAGGTRTLEEYYDFEGNGGFMKREDFLFRDTLELIAEHFEKRPFIFFMEEIKEDFSGLLAKFASLFGEKAPTVPPRTKAPVHVGVEY